MRCGQLIGCALLLLAVFSLGCKNATYRSSVPTYPVHKELNILGEYPHFVANGSVQSLVFLSRTYPTEAIGYAGLLVFTAMDEKYHAADLCCPKCLDRNAPVEVNGMFATCPICGEAYDISYGYCTPSRNISKEALRLYQTSYSGGKLLIYQ